jgi:signal transduction histidine kinase
MLNALRLPTWLARRRAASDEPTTLRASLLWLTAVTLLPMFVVASVGAVLLAREERATAERGAQEQVRALLTAVDAELRSTVTSLQTLAQSEALRLGQLQAFHAVMTRVRAVNPDWTDVNLVDAVTRRQLVEARRGPGDAPMDAVTADVVARAIASGQPVVSPVGPRPSHSSFTVAVPVPFDGRVRYVLSADVQPEAIQRLLLAQKLPPGSIATVLDAEQHVVARSFMHDKFVGRPATPGARAAVAREPMGSFRGTTLDGLEAYTRYAASEWSRWTVAVGAPVATVDAGARSVVVGALGFLALGTLGALAAAHVWSRRIAAPVTALAQRAQALGRGEPAAALQPIDTRLAEIRLLARNLEQGARAEHEAAAERSRHLAREQAMRSEAEAANRSKDRFLAMLSHELRNPLSAMKVATELLRRTAPGSDGHDRALAVLERQMRHMTRLVDDLLDAARVGSGKIELARVPVALHTTVRDAVGGLGERCASHALTLALEPVWVAGDETRLEQIVSNLLSNALRYTPAGGTIAVELAREGGDAVLTVRDSGIGIAPEMLPRLFQLFVQAQDGASGGLGIGLALVRRLTELHGGSVSAASEGLGRGSTFCVRLPAVAAPLEP